MNLARTISVRATRVIGFKTVPVCPSGVLVEEERERILFPWHPGARTHIVGTKLMMIDPTLGSDSANSYSAHKYFPEYLP